jgi:hypothetical protein
MYVGGGMILARAASSGIAQPAAAPEARTGMFLVVTSVGETKNHDNASEQHASLSRMSDVARRRPAPTPAAARPPGAARRRTRRVVGWRLAACGGPRRRLPAGLQATDALSLLEGDVQPPPAMQHSRDHMSIASKLSQAIVDLWTNREAGRPATARQGLFRIEQR